MENYIYPKGDFMSGFSQGDEICDYELACQTMVVRGMKYIDEHPDMKNILLSAKDCFDKKLGELIDCMSYSIEPTGAMVGITIKHLFYAQKYGWDKYINEITKTD